MPIQTILEADEVFRLSAGRPRRRRGLCGRSAPGGGCGLYPGGRHGGKTATASLTAGILTARGFCTGLYKAGAGPLSDRILVDGAPLAPGSAPAGAYLDAAGNILENTLLNRPAAELAAACACFEARAAASPWWKRGTGRWLRPCPPCPPAPSPTSGRTARAAASSGWPTMRPPSCAGHCLRHCARPAPKRP